MSNFQPPTQRSYKRAVGISLGMALLAPLAAMGVEQTAAPQSGVPQTQSGVPQIQTIIESPPQSGIPQTQVMDSFDTMQAPRDYVSGKVTSFASYIDRFFGGDRHYQVIPVCSR